jgi:hypothetical protein
MFFRKRKISYGIDIKTEYYLFRNIGRNGSKFDRYSSWKKYILGKYVGYEDKEYLGDMVRYLSQKRESHKAIRDIISTIIIPLITLLISIGLIVPSLIFSNAQYTDGILNEMNDFFPSNILLYDSFKDRIALLKMATDYNFYILIGTVTLILIIGIFYMRQFFHDAQSIFFYDSYIEIIEEIINDIS